MTSISKFINIALFLALISVSGAICLPLTAEIYFNEAGRLAATFKWKDAERKFVEAIQLDPFDARYIKGYGDFLLLQARYLDYKAPVISAAESCFAKAFKLNEYDAGSLLSIGLIELSRGRYDDAFIAFREAAMIDPNGYNTALSIGTSGVRVWKDIRKDEKVFVLDRLKFAIMDRPLNADDIYDKVWKSREDINLLRSISPNTLEGQKGLYDFIVTHDHWLFRKEQAEIVDIYRRMEDPLRLERDRAAEADALRAMKRVLQRNKSLTAYTINILKDEWQYKNKDGSYIRLQGPIYGNETICTPLNMEKGKANISIQLKKLLVIKTNKPDDPKYSPYVIIKLDDDVIGEMFVYNSEWQAYNFPVESDGGLKILSVNFVNDVYDPAIGEDRNLIIGDAEVAYETK